MAYLWIKALHVIFIICWMVGLLYLPRLFVYHSLIGENGLNHRNFDKGLISNKESSYAYNMLLVMERKLLFYITTPSMLLAISSGIVMLYLNSALLLFWWLHLKLLFALVILLFNLTLYKFYRDFRDNKNIKSSKFFRIINEIPTICLIIIVLLVIVRP